MFISDSKCTQSLHFVTSLERGAHEYTSHMLLCVSYTVGYPEHMVLHTLYSSSFDNTRDFHMSFAFLFFAFLFFFFSFCSFILLIDFFDDFSIVFFLFLLLFWFYFSFFVFFLTSFLRRSGGKENVCFSTQLAFLLLFSPLLSVPCTP